MTKEQHQLIAEIIAGGKNLTDWERQFMSHMEDYSNENKPLTKSNAEQVEWIHRTRVKR